MVSKISNICSDKACNNAGSRIIKEMMKSTFLQWQRGVLLVISLSIMVFSSSGIAAVEESKKQFKNKKSMLTSEVDIYYESEIRLPPVRYRRKSSEVSSNYSISSSTTSSNYDSSSDSVSDGNDSYKNDSYKEEPPAEVNYDNADFGGADSGSYDQYGDGGEQYDDSGYLDSNGVDSAAGTYGDEDWQAYDDPETGK